MGFDETDGRHGGPVGVSNQFGVRRRWLLQSALVAPLAAGGIGAIAGRAAAQSAGGAGDAAFLNATRTPDGGHLLCGMRSAESEPATLGWAVKLDDELDEDWSRTYLSPEHEETRAAGDLGEVHDAFAFALPDGDGYRLVGWYHFDDADGRNAWIVAIDGEGRRRWQREYHRPGVNTFQNTFADGVPTDDGGALLAGRTLASEATDEVHGDGWVVKIGDDGAVAWERTYNTLDQRHDGYGEDPRHDEFEAILQTEDGYLLAGEASPDGPTRSTRSAGWVVRIDPTGRQRWARTYRLSGEADNEILDLTAATDGGYVCCGTVGSDEHERIGPIRIQRTIGRGWVMKVDEAGDRVWQLAADSEELTAIAPASDGYLVAGSRDGTAWATRIDDAGERSAPVTPDVPPSSRFTSTVPTDAGHLLVGWGRDGADGPLDGLIETTGGSHTLEITKQDGGRAATLVVATGAIERTADSEAVVEGPSALDHVGRNGTDRLRFTGSIDTFVMKGRATVLLDGREVDPDRLGAAERSAADGDDLPNTLTVRSGGSSAGIYAVTVTGALEGEADSEAAIRGSSAVDWVGATGGTDTIRYSGSIRRFLLKGDADVLRNGERVDPDELGD